MQNLLLDAGSLRAQAELFSQYLIGKHASDKVIRLYSEIVPKSTETLMLTDTTMLSYVLKHPRSLAAIDAYSALFQPESELRRRIYIMFAILETQPSYWKDFLPVKRSPFYLIFIGWSGIRAVSRIALGALHMRAVKAQS